MDDLMAAARAALENAYAPYSHHRVGAAVRARNGVVYAGCNVENAAYPQGMCAEAAAIAAMVVAGATRLTEVLVIGETDGLCSPCGGCRQRLSEFGTAETAVHICGPEGLRQTMTLGALLPLAFGPKNLS
jgi:cytidine deaminase